MNNIEILEDYIEALRKPKPFKYTNEQKAQAIENLIQENKELKKEDKKYIVKLTDEQYRKLVDIIRNEINKEWETKVKEKIEELNKEMLKEENSLEIFYRKKYCKEFLQELLEEGE